MDKSKWFTVWVVVVTGLALLFSLVIIINPLDVNSKLVAFSTTPRFIGFNVLAVAVTLLSGLLAVYAFFWFVLVTIVTPIYRRIPTFVYFNKWCGKRLSTDYKEFALVVYRFHQELLKTQVVIEPYKDALQKANYGSQLVLVSSLQQGLTQAISRSFQIKDWQKPILDNCLSNLLTGVGSTIELSKCYQIQLLLLLAIGYVPDDEQFKSAYQYLITKHAELASVCGGGMTQDELKLIIKDLKLILPNMVFDFAFSGRSELLDTFTLFNHIKQTLGVR
jgi:hypothetical protein